MIQHCQLLAIESQKRQYLILCKIYKQNDVLLTVCEQKQNYSILGNRESGNIVCYSIS